MFWDKQYGPPVFANTMPRERFKLILRYFRFDERNSRARRRQRDRYAPIRELWESVMTNCSNAFIPHGSLTIDEQLFSCKSRCAFIQYMPMKPGKFGIKYWLICDAQTNYVLNAIPYVGKDEQRPDDRGLSDHVTLSLAKPYFGSGMNITTDNFFTNLKVAKELEANKLTMVGTVRANRREIPSELKTWGHSASLYSSDFYFTDTAMLVGYKAKKNKTVFLLTTLHSQPTIESSDTKRRPVSILDYNKQKGGVDTADQMLRGYSTKSPCRRWPMSAFFNLLDIVALNSYVICKDLEINTNDRYNFLLSLGEALCFLLLEQRKSTPGVLQLRDGKENSATAPAIPKNRTYCKCCMKNKTRIFCMNCKNFVCGTCSHVVCKNCAI